MAWTSNITIRRRLALVFAVVLCSYAGGALHSLWEMKKLAGLTETMYEHPLRVSNEGLAASLGVVRMHRGMKDAVLAGNAATLTGSIAIVREEETRVYEALDTVAAQILGAEGKALAREARRVFSDWKAIRDDVIALMQRGEREAATRITRGKGARHVAMLERKMLDLTAYARRKADGFMATARSAHANVRSTTVTMVVVVGLGFLLILALISRSIVHSVENLTHTMTGSTEAGELAKVTNIEGNEIGEIAGHYNRVIDVVQCQVWLREGINELGVELSGNLSGEELMTRGIRFVARHVDACAGVLYEFDTARRQCRLAGSYAFVEQPHFANSYPLGEGIVGQVAAGRQPILLRNIKRDDAVGASATVSEPPKSIYATPLIFEGELYGVLEITSFDDIKPIVCEFVDVASHVLATQLSMAVQNDRIKALLAEAKGANSALEAKSAELNVANAELQATNEELQSQSDELQAHADKLMAQAAELGAQRQALETADRLKSEFLSNMSHELRTPLNSVMALSQLLIARGRGNEPEQEIEYLRVIERNGRHLLKLINDILDLSKIEAGCTDVEVAAFDPKELLDRAVSTITALVQSKGLDIWIKTAADLPPVRSDGNKVHQILLNLLSNAVKFTEEGSVTVDVTVSAQTISFVVVDTGIGIAPEHLGQIFDEFRQVDGSTTRRYGGTGLGLAISQKLAYLLGGRISVQSTPGEGSTFTLALPVEAPTDRRLTGEVRTVPVWNRPTHDDVTAPRPQRPGGSDDWRAPAPSICARLRPMRATTAPRGQRSIHANANDVHLGPGGSVGRLLHGQRTHLSAAGPGRSCGCGRCDRLPRHRSGGRCIAHGLHHRW
jgi:signal transduction histidine kinase